MHEVVQAVILGVLIGGVYALMASGLTLVFGIMRVINVAQGALVILAAYLSYALFSHLHIDPFLSVLIVTPAMFVLGVLVQIVFVRSLRGSDAEELSLLVTWALALGIEGVLSVIFKTIYPSETTDMTPVVQKVASKHPDAVIGGTQNGDAYAQVKAMIRLKFSPRFLFLTNGPNDPAEFPSKVGAKNVNGIFSTGDWFPQEKSPGNAAFVKAYVKAYGGSASTIDPTSAEAFAAGQVVQDVAAKIHSLDNAKIISTLHSGSWPTVEGVLRWNSIGEPQGSDLLVEWINGKLYPVYPANIALHKPVVPKPPWGQ